MCRLGFISSKKEINVRDLIEGATRYYGRFNPHGIGFSYAVGNDIITIKSEKNANKFWDEKLSRSPIRSDAAIFHVRYASVGSVCKENSHPISNEKWTLAHNGTLTNYEAAKRFLENKGYRFKTTVDSEILLAAWTYYKEDFLTWLSNLGVMGWYTILILGRDRKIRAVTNTGDLVVYKRDYDALGFSDSRFRSLKKKYKIEEDVLYTFYKGRRESQKYIGELSERRKIERKSVDEPKLFSWARLFNDKKSM